MGVLDPLGVAAAILAATYLGVMFGHTIGSIPVIAPSFLFIVATSRRIFFYVRRAVPIV